MKEKKPGLILAVVGSRGVDDRQFVFEGIAETIKHKPRITGLVSGGAEGPDTFAQIFAQNYGMDILIIYPKWKEKREKCRIYQEY